MSPLDLLHTFKIIFAVYFAIAGLIAILTWSDIKNFIRLGGSPDTVLKCLALWPYNLAKGFWDWLYLKWFHWRYGPRKK